MRLSQIVSAFVGAALGFASLAVASGALAGPPPIEAYGHLPKVDHLTMSPSGQRIAFVSRTAAGMTVLIGEGGKAIQAAIISEEAQNGGKSALEAKIRYLQWVDEDHLLVFTNRTDDFGAAYGGKYVTGGVMVMTPRTKHVFWVFEHTDEVVKTPLFYFGSAATGGHLYGFFLGQTVIPNRVIGTHQSDIYRVDLDSGYAVKLVDAQNADAGWLLGPDGKVMAVSSYDNASQTWQLFSPGVRHVLLAQNKNPFNTAGTAGLGRTPGTVMYEAPDAAGGTAYYEVSAAGGSAPVRLFEGKRVDALLHDRRTRLLIGYATEGEHREIVFLDEQRQARWRTAVKAFPGLEVRLDSSDDAFDHIIVYTDGDGDSGTYWTVDLTSGKADEYALAYPGVKEADVGPRRMFDYTAADGLAMQAVLTLPPGHEAKNLPVVVLPHGGPQARDDVDFDWWAEALASRGYAVIQPNFRGSSGRGEAFVQAGYGEWGRKMQTDISDALAALAAKGTVDPKRACIMGGSYGGYAALAGVTVQHGLYRCAVSVAGIADLRAMLNDEVEHRHFADSPVVRYWKTFMGARRPNDPELAAISPADLAAGADAPILLIHGKDDTTVPIEQSRIMERALKRAGKPVEFVQLADEDHHLSREATRVAMLEAAIAFLEKYDPVN